VGKGKRRRRKRNGFSSNLKEERLFTRGPKGSRKRKRDAEGKKKNRAMRHHHRRKKGGGSIVCVYLYFPAHGKGKKRGGRKAAARDLMAIGGGKGYYLGSWHGGEANRYPKEKKERACY